MPNLMMLTAAGTDVSKVPEQIKLLPLGLVQTTKGSFTVDAESFELMDREFRERGLDLVIDYEHQTLSDQQAPAGGWIKELVQEEDAIAARVEWTPKAVEYLKNREYRYLSPVVLVRERDKKAVRLHSAALTNKPAIDRMFPVVASADYEMRKDDDAGMNELLKKLIALLGLDETATEEQVLEALGTLTAKEESTAEEDTTPVANKTICGLLGVPEDAGTEDIAAEIVKLKASESPLLLKVQALEERLARQDAESLVETALKAGKITPAMKEWATGYARENPKGFQAFTEKVPQVVPLGELLPDSAPDVRSGGEPDAETLKVCKMMGVSAEDLKKYGTGGEV